MSERFFSLAMVLASCTLLGYLNWSDEQDVSRPQLPLMPTNSGGTLISAPKPAASAKAVVASDETAFARRARIALNNYRSLAGLPPVAASATIQEAARCHANFVLANPTLYEDGLSIHEEEAGNLEFCAARFWERMKYSDYEGLPFREVIAYQETPEAAVAHWMETVYHRLPLLSTWAVHMGYSQKDTATADRPINVLDLGADDGSDTDNCQMVVWPPDGVTEVDLSWDGYESPQPPAPPNGYPSGPIITASFDLGTKLEVYGHSVTELNSGTNLEHTLLTPENDPHLEGESSLAIYTHSPLKPDQTYQVTVNGFVDGWWFGKSWSFTTRPTTGCDQIDQDCSLGKGCYGSSGKGICAWAGSAQVGESCDYQNECAKGMVCAGGSCKQYCTTASENQKSCHLCRHYYFLLSEADDLGACRTL